MKNWILIALCLVPSYGFASSFTLTNNDTSERFQCTNGGGGGGGGGQTNPQCVQSVSKFCNSNTTYSRDTCFDKASTSCRGAPANFPGCVEETFQFCNSNTTLSRDACFERGLESCRGDARAIRELAESAKMKVLQNLVNER